MPRGIKGAPQLNPYKFKPGQSGNINGRPKNLITREQVSILFQKLSIMPEKDLQDITSDQGKSAMERGAALAWIQYSKTGDYSKVRDLMEHMIGKVPNESINEIISNQEVENIIDAIPTQKLIELVESLPDDDKT